MTLLEQTVVEPEAIDSEIETLFSAFDLQRARTIDRSLRKSSESAPNHKQVAQMHRLCVLYAYFARPVDGYSTAKAAVRLARELGDLDGLRKALTARAALRRMAGDINSAIEDNVEAYLIARQLGDDTAKCNALSNLIFALGLIDLDDLALRLAERVLVSVNRAPVGFSEVNAVTNLMVNVADLLLWRDPSRAINLTFDVDRVLGGCVETMPASERLQLETRRTVALMNRVVAAVNLRDQSAAKAAVDGLHVAVANGVIPRLQQCANVALATYEASFGDRAFGVEQLREISETGVDEAAVEALRRLVEFHEMWGSTSDMLEALRLLQIRLQSVRRTVGLEELGRIEALGALDDLDVQGTTASRLARLCYSVQGLEERFAAKLKHLEGIAITAELREGTEMNRAQHIFRVGKLCSELAAAAGCSTETQWLAEITGRLHDIGKCAVPDTMILDSGELTDAARSMLRDHADYGARLIADADEPRLVQVVAAVRHHHERFDGTGYPSRLTGEEIPLLARIVSICECFDAMLQSRTYRGSRTVLAALEEIERCAGVQFDPVFAGHFVGMVRRLQREHEDLLEYLGEQSRFNRHVASFEQLEHLMVESRARL